MVDPRVAVKANLSVHSMDEQNLKVNWREIEKWMDSSMVYL